MTDFVKQGSIVRRIWGDGDMVMIVFAGSAAEFALNRAVDWLFFTGKLPNDPIGRLFTTAAYSQQIVFADQATATRTFERIRAAHSAVEAKRGQAIPDWAHRDVLYMLIDYSERAHKLLARPLTHEEQAELYDVFRAVGRGLGIPSLPVTYKDWKRDREAHLHADLVRSEGTDALLSRYRLHLGPWRYALLSLVQSAIAPRRVRDLLSMRNGAWLRPVLRLYPVLARAGMRTVIHGLLIPPQHLAAVRNLDQPHTREAASTRGTQGERLVA